MKKSILFLILFLLTVVDASAQRKQNLGRGVVANYSSDKGVLISWRRLIQDPEDICYNVYIGSTKLNAQPLKNTNYSTTAAKVPNGSKITVRTVDANGNEGQPSVPFTYNQYYINGNLVNNAYYSVNYTEAGSPLNSTSFVTKYCWPVDLDGDGEMEYVINRIYKNKDRNGCVGWGDDKLGGDCIEAYSREGKHLWTVNLSIHFYAFEGQMDGVIVGDFDADGKGDVCIQVCEGARFWDPAKKTFGKYLYYNGEQASYTGSGMQTVSSDGSDPDIDKDGITNYTSYSQGKNPQAYMVLVDGETGTQKAVCAMTLPSDKGMTYTRTNKSFFMGDEYPYLDAGLGVAYLDGYKQSIYALVHSRTTSNVHHYFAYAYSYEDGGLKEKWIYRFNDQGGPSEFHHNRIGDVDGDGFDEIMTGAGAIDQNGKMLYDAGIGHGDRFRLSDIDPDRPGQEIFAIQQTASDMLGQILYDAADGSPIKKWYLNNVGDVGRGECMDMDSTHKGYEIFSTMGFVTDCKGNVISNSCPFPYEGIWWDGLLDREEVITPGSGNNCAAAIAKWNGSNGWNRIREVTKLSGNTIVADYGVRAMFWGDIYGDWREELILKQYVNGDECGFACLTTGDPTSVDNIYCLLQDPGYYAQMACKGYYQSPNTSFYLGFDMPRPPLPPFIQPDEDNAVYDLKLGNASVTASETASNLYFMPVKNQVLTLANPTLNIKNLLWKSQQGTLVVNNTANGNVIISEGTLQVDGQVNGNVDLRARGTLSGKGTVKTITLEGALNYEGGRIMPKNGTLTIDGNVELSKDTYIEIDLKASNLLKINGDLAVSAPVVFTLTLPEGDAVGEYKLVEYTGSFSGSQDLLSIRGITGVPTSIVLKENAIWLVVNGQRDASDNVVWTGAETSTMDYAANNFKLGSDETPFVANDGIVFNDGAKATTISVPEIMPVGSVTFNNNSSTYTLNGDGGFSGNGGMTFNGNGRVNINVANSTYTGATIINSGTVAVKELGDAGAPSSFGAAAATASLFQIGKATLIINNSNTSTNRILTLNDTATVNIASGGTSFRGQVRGNGVLVKTGAGQINITYAGSNTWAGTILQGGTMAMGAWNTTFGKTTSPIHVTGNSTIRMFDNNSSSAMPNFQNSLTIDAGKTLTFAAGSRCMIKGSLHGEGTFKISFPYVRGDVYTDVSDFKGVYEAASTNCRFVQAMDFSKATLKVDEGAAVVGVKAGGSTEQSYTHKVGSLAGSGNIGIGVWNVGYLGKDDSFSGTFNANATLNKYGQGSLSLTGASSNTINVREGTLLARNTASSITTGGINIYADALLAGNGQARSVTVMKGGTIGAGNTSTFYGTLTLNGNLTVQDGGQVRLRYYGMATGATADQIKVAGATVMTNPVFVIPSINGAELPDDAELKVFTGVGSITVNGQITVIPEKPKDGWSWDFSYFTSNGIIRIVKDIYDGIEGVAADGNSSKSLYDLSGKRVDKVNGHGAFIVNGKKVKY